MVTENFRRWFSVLGPWSLVVRRWRGDATLSPDCAFRCALAVIPKFGVLQPNEGSRAKLSAGRVLIDFCGLQEVIVAGGIQGYILNTL